MRFGLAAAVLSLLALAACTSPKPPPPPARPEAPTPAPTPVPVPTAIPAPAPLPTPLLPPRTAFLTGTVTYRERIALTPQAEVHVELRDVSIQDVPAVTIVKQVIATPGQVPIPFSLEYDPAKILPRRSYAVSARIVDRGQLLFVTDTRFAVLTGAAQEPVEVVVVPVR